jgi:transposase
MSSVALSAGPIHLGMDTSKDKIAVGILRWEEQVPDVEIITNDEPSVRRLIGRLGDPAGLRSCYEAGPTGFGLHRLLTSMGVACQVIAPSLIPKAPGDRVKTDKRDCRRLARLHRAGELVAIRVPTEAEEGVRDLCRARADLVQDRTRTRHRLSKFLLRHDRIWRAQAWTGIHEAWVAGQRFDDPGLQATFGHYRAVLAARDGELAAIEADLAYWYTHGPFADAVTRLAAYRGVARLGALTIASEVGDWRRFPTARAFMGFTGLVPSEYSSGAAVRRGHITKAGNAHLRTQLIESAWAYQHRASLGALLRRRQDGVEAATAARSWTAQQRLCSRFRRLSPRKSSRNVVVVAIARELAGFLWAEMTTDLTGAAMTAPTR